MNLAEKISKYERLNEITDELNSLFQDSFVEEIKTTTSNPSDLLYKAMEIIDSKAMELEEEILIQEGVDSIYDIKI